jgi:hypothetical protein
MMSVNLGTPSRSTLIRLLNCELKHVLMKGTSASALITSTNLSNAHSPAVPTLKAALAMLIGTSARWQERMSRCWNWETVVLSMKCMSS